MRPEEKNSLGTAEAAPPPLERSMLLALFTHLQASDRDTLQLGGCRDFALGSLGTCSGGTCTSFTC